MHYLKKLEDKEAFLNPLLIIIYCLLLYIYSQYDTFSHLYRLNDDFPQHFIWLYEYWPHFFQDNDFYLQASKTIQPWGVYWLNRFLTIVISPISLSKYFPFFTLLMTSFFTFFLVRKRFSWILAFVAMLMLSNIPLERMIGFNARAYATPLLLGFLYYWNDENKKGIQLLLIASTLFYPIIFLVECGIVGLAYLKLFLKKKLFLHYKEHLGVIITIIACGILLLIKSYQLEQSEYIGAFFSKTELLSMPEFMVGGRVDFVKNMNPQMPLDFPWHYYLHSPFPKYALPIVGLFLSILLVNLIKGSKHKRFDESLLLLLLSGTIIFYLAQWFLPHFFIPQRYLYYTYLPFLFLLVIRMFSFIKPTRYKLLVNMAILVLLSYSVFHVKSPKDVGITNYEKHKVLYQNISKFQQPLLFAGPAGICDQIPSFCRQSVLFSVESAHAIYFKKYYHYVKPKVDDFITAYTSTDIKDLVFFVKKYDIDYLIVDNSFLSSAKLWFYEPYRQILKEKMLNIDPKALALNQLPDELLEEGDWRYQLLNCEKLLLFYGQ